MVHLIRYLTILENADKIVRSFGTYPDPDNLEYIAARQIYDLAFAELLRAGMPFERRGNVVVIATDGVEYGYTYREEGEEDVYAPDMQDMPEILDIQDIPDGQLSYGEASGSPYDPAEAGGDGDLPAEIDENDMEENSAVITDAQPPEEEAPPEMPEPPEEEPAEPDDAVYGEPAEPAPAAEDGDGSSPGDRDLSEHEEPDEGDAFPEPGADGLEFPEVEEPSISETMMAEPDFPEDEEPGMDDVAEDGMKEPDIPEGEPDMDNEDAEAKEDRPDIEAIETEPDENPASRGQMPTRLKAKDHTMASHHLEIIDERPTSDQNTRKTTVLSMPLSLDTENPRIIALIMEKDTVKTAVSQKKENFVRLTYKNIPIIVSGRMQDGRYISECRVGGNYADLGIRLESEDKTYGTMGHVVMDDDEEDVHVHLMPIGFKNAPGKPYANFSYLIEEKGKEQIGNNIRALNGTVPFVIEGKTYYLSASWSEDQEFLCHITDA